MVGEDSIRRSGLRGLIAEPDGETVTQLQINSARNANCPMSIAAMTC